MDAWLTRMYERDGRRYLWACIFAAAAACMVVVGPLATAFVATYEGATIAEWARVVAAAEIATAVGIGVICLCFRRDFRALVAWSTCPRDGDVAEAAALVAFSLPRRLAATAFFVAITLVLPVAATTLLVTTGNTSALDFAEIGAGGMTLLVMAAVMLYGCGELFLKPIRHSLAIRQRVERGSSLRFNLIVGGVALVVAAGNLAVSGTARRAEDGAGALGEGLLLAWLVTAVFAAVLWPLVSGTILGPIRSLIHGVREVARGELDVAVDVTSRDELGELASGFNEMVEGLRERETLRGEKMGLVDELRASQARIVAAADESRRHVERDLHDGAQQSLVLLNLKLGLLEREAAENPNARALAADARADLERALAELRDLAHGIYPQVLTSDGLPGALAEVADQAAIPIELSLNGARRYPPEIEAAVYFCCLEALQNAAKHAGEGAKATVTLSQINGELRFEVADDGAGFDAHGSAVSAGLQNMADRIGALGGELRVESAPGAGTTIRGAIPVRR